ncbi:ankyrin repeat-containing domain protein [Phlyctochytrium arcticum]|nr:ankyrin repeat-containing domain protein [Phlyctochytrium arcticum]
MYNNIHIPIPRVVFTTPRGLVVEWLGDVKLSGIKFQLSRAEADEIDFMVVYEGAETSYEINDLKPKTGYRLKLRVRGSDDYEDDWSKEFTEATGTTTDETISTRLVTQLFRAISNNDAKVMDDIIKKHPKELHLEARDRYGKTMLMNACQAASGSIVKLLLQAGALPTAITRVGKTPLSLAASFANLEAVEELLNFDKESLDMPDQGGSTPLMWAAENAGAKNKNGPAVVERLLQAGADVNAKDARGHTALDRLCSSSGNVAAAQILLKAGARVLNTVDKSRDVKTTSLMMAAMNGHRDLCVELMTNWKCDPDVQTDSGGTARAFAKQAGYNSVVKAIDEEMDRRRKKLAEFHPVGGDAINVGA